MATKQKKQLQDVSSRLEYLEKVPCLAWTCLQKWANERLQKALEKTTSPQEIELRLMALERHYEGLLDKLTSIEHSESRLIGDHTPTYARVLDLTRPHAAADDDSDDEPPRRRRHRAVSEDGEDTDDDEAAVQAASKSSKPSMTSTVAMVVAGGVMVWTALALS